jgi:hypothetical protein
VIFLVFIKLNPTNITSGIFPKGETLLIVMWNHSRKTSAHDTLCQLRFNVHIPHKLSSSSWLQVLAVVF